MSIVKVAFKSGTWPKLLVNYRLIVKKHFVSILVMTNDNVVVDNNVICDVIVVTVLISNDDLTDCIDAGIN
jgi:hypothetical protein